MHLRVPVLKELPPINLLDEGMVRRVRGIAHSMRVPPQNTNRMVDGARGVLNDFLADVYVFTDHMSGKQAGNSPGPFFFFLRSARPSSFLLHRFLCPLLRNNITCRRQIHFN